MPALSARRDLLVDPEKSAPVAPHGTTGAQTAARREGSRRPEEEESADDLARKALERFLMKSIESLYEELKLLMQRRKG
jgi:hypothetical protein